MKRWFVGPALLALLLLAQAGCMLLAAGAVESGHEERNEAARKERARQQRCRDVCAEQFAEEPARRSLCEDDCAKGARGG